MSKFFREQSGYLSCVTIQNSTVETFTRGVNGCSVFSIVTNGTLFWKNHHFRKQLQLQIDPSHSYVNTFCRIFCNLVHVNLFVYVDIGNFCTRNNGVLCIQWESTKQWCKCPGETNRSIGLFAKSSNFWFKSTTTRGNRNLYVRDWSGRNYDIGNMMSDNNVVYEKKFTDV